MGLDVCSLDTLTVWCKNIYSILLICLIGGIVLFGYIRLRCDETMRVDACCTYVNRHSTENLTSDCCVVTRNMLFINHFGYILLKIFDVCIENNK